MPTLHLSRWIRSLFLCLQLGRPFSLATLKGALRRFLFLCVQFGHSFSLAALKSVLRDLFLCLQLRCPWSLAAPKGDLLSCRIISVRGVCLPDEIIHAFVVHLLPDEQGEPLSSQAKRALSPCILVCKHWALQLRPRLFQHITLSSRTDIDTFIALAKTGLPTEQPISACVRVLHFVVQLPPGPAEKPWLHLVNMLEPFTKLAVKHFVCRPNSRLASEIEHPARQIFSTIPKSLPQDCVPYTVLSFSRMIFSSTLDAIQILRRLRSVQSCTFRDVTFKTVAAAPRPCHRSPRPRLEFVLTVSETGAVHSGDKSPDMNVPISLLASIRCTTQESKTWMCTARLAELLFSQLYSYTSATALYLPSNDEASSSRTQLLAMGATPQTASLVTSFGLPASDNLAVVVSIALILPSEIGTTETDWVTRLQQCLLEFDLPSVPITVYTRTDTCDLLIPHVEAQSGLIGYRLLTQLHQLQLKAITPEQPASFHTFVDCSDPGQLPGIVVPQMVQ